MNNNHFTFADFLIDLVAKIDSQRPAQRHNHVLLLDNCPAHRTELILKIFNRLRIPVTFTAPASYDCLPVESTLGLLKNQQLRLNEFSQSKSEQLHKRPQTIQKMQKVAFAIS
jgi:hypothetical protein